MLKKIKSKLIVQLIFKKLKNIIKLKIIKYNKYILNRLNVALKDYENYKLLKEVNQKYSLNIKDIDILEIKLAGSEKINELLEDLNKIEFRELKELFLKNNNISDLSILNKQIFEKLEHLNLYYNNLPTINGLEKVNLKYLKILSLVNNKISEIKILEMVKFENLEILALSSNNISDIHILKNVNFIGLK